MLTRRPSREFQADGAGAERSALIRAMVAHGEVPIPPTNHADLFSSDRKDLRDGVLEVGFPSDVHERVGRAVSPVRTLVDRSVQLPEGPDGLIDRRFRYELLL